MAPGLFSATVGLLLSKETELVVLADLTGVDLNILHVSETSMSSV